MRVPRALLRAASLAVVVLLLGGCSDDGRAATEPSDDRREILVAAVRWVVASPQPIVPHRPIDAVDLFDRFPNASGAFLTFDPQGVALTEAERAAIDAAITLPVRWVAREMDGACSNAGDVPAQPTVLLAVPHIDGDTATVRHELACGRCCRSGSTILLARGTNGAWTVTGTRGGFIT